METATMRRTHLQGLRNEIRMRLNKTTDEEILRQCVKILSVEDEYPCTYTDEEFAEELRLSEASCNATEEEVNEMFARWIAGNSCNNTIKKKRFL